MHRSDLTFFLWLILCEDVNIAAVFLVNPERYLYWHFILSIQRIDPLWYSKTRIPHFEIVRIKAKARQATIIQSSIDAKVRCQFRHAARNRYRIYG